MSGIAGSVTADCAGTVLNARELRERLEYAGHHFATEDDGELVARLYEEHGESFARRLRGPFAVVLRDARRVVLARDRFGLEPLFYREHAGGVELVSDLRGGELDPDAVDAYLAYGWIPPPMAIVRGVRKLPPGHVLVAEADGTHRLERFARPAFEAADERRDDDVAELAEELRSRLRDSVRAHVGGAERIGVVVAGDLYSAAVAALAAQERTRPIRRLAPVHALDAPDAFDEPVADPSLIARPAADDVDVVLTGEGGLDLFEPAPPRELFTPDERAALTGRRSELDLPDLWAPPRARGLRRPFLDTVVTNLALACREPGPLLRRALRPLLPRTAPRDPLARPPLPGDLRQRLARQDVFDPGAVTQLIDEYEAGRREREPQLWALLVFAAWRA